MIIDVVVASTSRFQKFGAVKRPEDALDLSGQVILERIKAAGHTPRYALHQDGFGLREIAEKSDGDALVICGGTGLGPQDLTLEAIEPLFEKTLPGFGEIFRNMSLEEVGTRAMLTRAAAGIYNARPIFCLPGSPGAARLGMDLILAEIDHIIGHIRE
ncbi:MAG: MogA/MoaB family molybdenum cofactor biosynthesis protein [Methanothrix sp.]|jgi:molybdenum cofactor biosynthesis protein B|nr:MogA/MoaB family molybdenum cofactor biosynthesis protein [Methanothrix sp.]